ncbi:MAG: T9SS type A sorting domain-containing protein [Bacteroidetes bacterium]|nr:T9SS type A sorting domain-containing protein [Bacteroidota bacterium]
MKILKFVFLILCLAMLHITNAQNKRANIWYFGNKAGLDFSTNPPTALTNSSMNTYEGCASICDTSGNLLFYTNGEKVWNKSHQLMLNGSGLMGSWDATQSSIIIPWPERDSLFYIFTTDAVGGQNGFQWHLVNMNLDSGRGAVVSKNNLIVTPVCEKLAATLHANGRDIWVVVHGFSRYYGPYNNDSFYSYLVTSNGFQSCPVISKVGGVHGNLDPFTSNSVDVTEAQGQMCFNANGKFLGVTCYQYPTPYEGIEIFEFDNGNGRLKVYSKGKTVLPFGFSFNADGTKYYTTTRNGQLLEYQNLKDSNVTPNVLYVSNTPKAWTLASMAYLNDSIILLSCTDSFYMSAVHVSPSSSTYFDSRYIYLNGRKNLGGIPSFISNYFNSKEPKFISKIIGDSVHIYPELGNVLEWLLYRDSFLYSHSFRDTTAFYIPSRGNYLIKMVDSKNDTFERRFTYQIPILEVRDTMVCDRDSFAITANDNYHCVYWNDTIYSTELNVFKNGTYKIQGIDGNGNSSTDSIRVTFFKSPNLNLGKDTLLCNGNSIILQGADSSFRHVWNNGDTSYKITVSNSGNYILEESNHRCLAVDSIRISFFNIGQPFIQKNGDYLSVNPGYRSFQWYIDNQPINTGRASQYVSKQSGKYYVQVMDSNGCVANSDTVGLNTGFYILEKPSLFVHPNPVNDQLMIDNESPCSWELTDITGRTILNGTSKSIDFSLLPSSLYILKINSNNYIHTFKIIKE